MIGIDVVDISRMRGALSRTPDIALRLFTENERAYCRTKGDEVARLAGTLAAKEAVIKALRLGPLVAWARRIEVTRDPHGVPSARVSQRGEGRVIAVSISHDGTVAVAAAITDPR